MSKRTLTKAQSLMAKIALAGSVLLGGLIAVLSVLDLPTTLAAVVGGCVVALLWVSVAMVGRDAETRQ